MKKLVNEPEDLVKEALSGIAAAAPISCASITIPTTSSAQASPSRARSASCPASGVRMGDAAASLGIGRDTLRREIVAYRIST